MLFDTHCHLNDQKSFPDPAEYVNAARAAGVNRIADIGCRPSEWETSLALSRQFEEVYSVLGWHPNYAAHYTPEALEPVEDLLKQPKVVALGEIGLDYHWDYAPRELQYDAFRAQMEMAIRTEKPIVIHAREAYSDVLDILEAHPHTPVLFHCFAGNLADAERAVKLDCYFGVDGPITYKKADELREVFAWLPRDRVVIETDAPYLAPVPFRGKTNQPAYVAHVNEGLAAVWKVDAAECAAITTANGNRFFGLN